jgi:hypothetical protein
MFGGLSTACIVASNTHKLTDDPFKNEDMSPFRQRQNVSQDVDN